LLAERILDLRGEKTNQIAERMAGHQPEKIFITDAVMSDVSATSIRRAVREHFAELNTMVSPPVADYIRKYRLYKDSNEN
jgi:nicotinic acid mononucleotide adenylyltransferase